MSLYLAEWKAIESWFPITEPHKDIDRDSKDKRSIKGYRERIKANRGVDSRLGYY